MTSRPNDPNITFAAALAVLDAGLATTQQLRDANAWRHTQRPQIGKLAMSQGKLSMGQIFEILSTQAANGKLFGEIAVELGFLQDELYFLLKQQEELTPTLLESLVTLGFITTMQAEVLALRISSCPVAASANVPAECLCS